MDNADLSANLTFLVDGGLPFFLNATMFVNVQPCRSTGPTIDITLQDTDLNESHVYPQFNSNTSSAVPLNLSLSTPIGSLGVYASYNISGEPWSNITFSLTADLCFVAPFKFQCASQMPDPYPKIQQTLLAGTYNIISHCIKMIE
jgi:hypothetical protein